MRWGSPHAVLTSLLGVEGAHFFGALLQDFFIDKHTSETILSNEDALSAVQKKTLQEEVASILSKLTTKEEQVLRLRYGFDGHERTLEEVGTKFNVTRERIRQIEGKALRKLRHPSKSEILKEYY